MAEPVKWKPKVAPRQTAREELEELIETLHRSGTLRVLNGLFGQLPEVSKVAVEHANAPAGRNVIGNLSVAAAGLAELSTDHFKEMAIGLAKGLGQAHRSAKQRAPGRLRVLAMMQNADTRRGLYAMLVMLNTLGKHLDPDKEPSTAVVPAGA